MWEAISRWAITRDDEWKISLMLLGIIFGWESAFNVGGHLPMGDLGDDNSRTSLIIRGKKSPVGNRLPPLGGVMKL